MGAKGDLPHSGDVCRTPADLGKSCWGFAIMHPYQYGVKKGINGVQCATWLVEGPSSPLRGSITGLQQLS